MAFDLNFGYTPTQSPLMDMSYNPTQSSVLTSPMNFMGSGTTSPANTGMMSAFTNWLGGDTGRALFGGTDPTTGFQSMGMVSPAMQGLGALFQAWNGMQTLGLAEDQLKFQQNAFNTNLANQKQVYNTALEDRIRGRSSEYAGKEEDVDKYMSEHSL